MFLIEDFVIVKNKNKNSQFLRVFLIMLFYENLTAMLMSQKLT